MDSRALTPARMAAFADELEKEAFSPSSLLAVPGAIGRFTTSQIGGAASGAGRALRMFQPGRAKDVLQRGWSHMEPVQMARDSLKLKAMRQGLTWEQYAAKQGLPANIDDAIRGNPEMVEQLTGQLKSIAAQEGRVGSRLPTWLGGSGRRAAVQKELKTVTPRGPTAAHLADESQPLASVWRDPKALAEELSRRGWTGTGDVSKYAPVGGKGLLAGFGLGFSPHVLKKDDPHARGLEGKHAPKGRFERAGKHVGGHLGLVAGLPTGFAGSLAGWEVGSRGLGLAGKGLDVLTGEKKRALEATRAKMQRPTAPPPYQG